MTVFAFQAELFLSGQVSVGTLMPHESCVCLQESLQRQLNTACQLKQQHDHEKENAVVNMLSLLVYLSMGMCTVAWWCCAHESID